MDVEIHRPPFGVDSELGRGLILGKFEAIPHMIDYRREHAEATGNDGTQYKLSDVHCLCGSRIRDGKSPTELDEEHKDKALLSGKTPVTLLRDQ
ncbi:hypothetical protein Tco_1204120 [Tanacetum coccineum]